MPSPGSKKKTVKALKKCSSIEQCPIPERFQRKEELPPPRKKRGTGLGEKKKPRKRGFDKIKKKWKQKKKKSPP